MGLGEKKSDKAHGPNSCQKYWGTQACKDFTAALIGWKDVLKRSNRKIGGKRFKGGGSQKTPITGRGHLTRTERGDELHRRITPRGEKEKEI